MELIYNIKDKPPIKQMMLFAFQQVLAIISATITVPMVVSAACGVTLSSSAALFGAGIGTLVYLLFTKFLSPVFLGSSFAYIGCMCAAFAGASSMGMGYAGLIIGAALAGLVYVVLGLLVKAFGSNWVNKLLPTVIIGPTVAIIGLSLAGSAVSNLTTSLGSPYVALVCGIATFLITVAASVFSKRIGKLIPFIIGIAGGYALALVFYAIGAVCHIPALQIFTLPQFNSLFTIPDFTFTLANFKAVNWAYILTLFVAYAPVAFVSFAEHIADHKNLSTIIDIDLLEKPGLHRTLFGDGVGSIAGAFFGGCPNTTYGESIGCVAITKNASVMTILTASLICMLISFIGPIVSILASIPACVMGGVCVALYGFIAVSGLKMIQNVDLGDNKNLFVVSSILICGIGGLSITIGAVSITSIACAMILGIVTNFIVNRE